MLQAVVSPGAAVAVEWATAAALIQPLPGNLHVLQRQQLKKKKSLYMNMYVFIQAQVEQCAKFLSKPIFCLLGGTSLSYGTDLYW